MCQQRTLDAGITNRLKIALHMDSMFDKLMDLPLFKGISLDRMEKTVGTHKFHFLKYLPGETIFRENDQCTDISFILSGTVMVKMVNNDGRFSASYCLKAPEVITPEFLFGKRTTYPGNITAVDNVSILSISKNDYLKILRSDTIFMLNYLNLVAMGAQKPIDGILAVSSRDLAARIALWISSLTPPRSFDINIRCSQCDLATLFGVPSDNLNVILDSLHTKGLATHTPETLTVTDRKKFITLLHGDQTDE